MGLFDDDSDYDRPEKPATLESKQGAMERRHGMSRSDVVRGELGGGWSKRQVGIVAALLLIAGVLFVLHFGTNTSTLTDQVKQSLGQKVAPLPARVLAIPSVGAVKVRYLEGGKINVGAARLVGLAAPGRCYDSSAAVARVLRAGARVTLAFTSAGRADANGHLLVVATAKGRNENVALLRAGAARLDAPQAKQAGVLKAYQHAEATARSAGRGLWAQCR